jgi:hypothetical protein
MVEIRRRPLPPAYRWVPFVGSPGLSLCSKTTWQNLHRTFGVSFSSPTVRGVYFPQAGQSTWTSRLLSGRGRKLMCVRLSPAPRSSPLELREIEIPGHNRGPHRVHVLRCRFRARRTVGAPQDVCLYGRQSAA